jgi:hypothetical protein
VALLTSALVTLVVWTVSMVPSVRLRAFVYSLPLPMTLVLATTDVRVDGAQFVGMVGLVGFFGVVSVLHERLGWPILLADLGGVAAYLAFGAVLGALPTPPAAWAIGTTVLVWAVLVAVLRPWRPVAEPVRRRRRLHPIATLGLVFTAALVVTQLAGLVRGLVVTFPFSGVLVVVETRRQLSAFTRQVVFHGIGLVAFLAGCLAAQEHGRVVALLAGWVAFGLTAAVLAVAAAAARAVAARESAG